ARRGGLRQPARGRGRCAGRERARFVPRGGGERRRRVRLAAHAPERNRGDRRRGVDGGRPHPPAAGVDGRSRVPPATAPPARGRPRESEGHDMRFSIYTEVQSWPGKSHDRLYGEVLEQIENADRLGYDAYAAIEHFFFPKFSASANPF